jgi:hypothetical protein
MKKLTWIICLVVIAVGAIETIEPADFNELVQYYSYEQERANPPSRSGDAGEMLVDKPDGYESFDEQAQQYVIDPDSVIVGLSEEEQTTFDEFFQQIQQALQEGGQGSPWDSIIPVLDDPPPLIMDNPAFIEVCGILESMVSSEDFQTSFNEAVNEQAALRMHRESLPGPAGYSTAVAGVAAEGALAGASSAAGEAYGEYEATGDVDMGEVVYNVTVEAAYGAYDALMEHGQTVVETAGPIVETIGEATNAAYHAAAETLSNLFSGDDG